MYRLRLFALLCLAVPLSLMVGSTPLPLADFLLFASGQGSDLANLIFGQIRAPRIALACLCGFALGLAGAAVQALLRNPLAEPGLLGASNAAALGAVIVIYLGLSGTLSLAVPLAASGGALISVRLLIAFAGRGASSLRLILAGVAVSAAAGAGIALALNLSPNPFAAYEIAFWLLGAVENRSWLHFGLAAPGIALGCALMRRAAHQLDALSLGEDVATSLGVALPRLRRRIALGLALAVGSAVAVTGVIGFIGLAAPHLIRAHIGHLPSQSLVPAGLMGALLLSLADIFVRLVPTQAELKLGVVTAFIGVPILLHILRRHDTG